MKYVVCYDVASQSRRSRLAKVLLDYGVRIQLSVFEADLPCSELLGQMVERAVATVSEEEDTLRLYTLCAKCQSRTMIWGPESASSDEQDVLVF